MNSGRIALSVGCGVLLFGSLAGCSSGSDAVWREGRALPSISSTSLPSPSSPPSSPVPSTPSSPASAGTDSAATPGSPVVAADPDRFVEAVRRQMPDLAMDRRDEEIADLGDEACASLRTQGQDNLSAYGVSADQARRLRTMARADLCP